MQYEQQKRPGSADRGMGLSQNLKLRQTDSRFCGGRRDFESHFGVLLLTPRFSKVLIAQCGPQPLQPFPELVKPLKRLLQHVLLCALLKRGVNETLFSSQNT